MKKILLLLLISIAVIIFSICGLLITINNNNRVVKQDNLQYECYLQKEVYGTEVITVINKAINQNEKNEIEKDEKKFYIQNDTNSIEVEVKMLITGKTYSMEKIYNNDITKFVQNFDLIKFKCTKIEYHKKTGRISKILFEEQE